MKANVKKDDRRVLVQGFHRGLLPGAAVMMINSTSGKEYRSVAEFIHFGRQDRADGNWHYKTLNLAEIRRINKGHGKPSKRPTSRDVRETKRELVDRAAGRA